jgi:tetratricopeptide (TPR) repeat protein
MNYLDLLKYDELFFEADALIAEKKTLDAMQILEGIIIENPEYGKAYNHLGWIFETKYKSLEKAEEMYKKCIFYTPNYTPVYFNLSVLLSTLGKYDEQEAHLKQALTITGIEKSSIYNEMGILYELKSDYTKAVACYKDAIRSSLNSTSLETYKASIERCNYKTEILG